MGMTLQAKKGCVHELYVYTVMQLDVVLLQLFVRLLFIQILFFTAEMHEEAVSVYSLYSDYCCHYCHSGGTGGTENIHPCL